LYFMPEFEAFKTGTQIKVSMKEKPMRFLRFSMLALSLFSAQTLSAQNSPPIPNPVEAPPELSAIPLSGAANAKVRTREIWTHTNTTGHMVRNVTRPTLTPFLPKPGTATGAAVIVAPGGAFMLLAMEHEGWKVAQRLADRGIAAFVLKYRIMPTPVDNEASLAFMNKKAMEGIADPTKQPTLQYPPSTDDALAALAMVRARSAEWGVNPKRVGMIGFSAGAMTSLNTVIAAKPGAGPDFFGYIYGPQAKADVRADAPPMFAAIAFDDPLFPSMGFPLVEAWKAAKRPVELHAYERGGHGFNLGVPGTTTTGMLDQFVSWMDMQGLMRPETRK
jgi:acetyl esterase/lipase